MNLVERKKMREGRKNTDGICTEWRERERGGGVVKREGGGRKRDRLEDI